MLSTQTKIEKFTTVITKLTICIKMNYLYHFIERLEIVLFQTSSQKWFL